MARYALMSGELDWEYGGGFGDAAMSRNLGSSGLYDDSLIDDRNARPLTIAFATIVMVWMLAFGIVSVSVQIGVQSRHNGGKRGVDREVISVINWTNNHRGIVDCLDDVKVARCRLA
jgi:hypothetical protein